MISPSTLEYSTESGARQTLVRRVLMWSFAGALAAILGVLANSSLPGLLSRFEYLSLQKRVFETHAPGPDEQPQVVYSFTGQLPGTRHFDPEELDRLREFLFLSSRSTSAPVKHLDALTREFEGKRHLVIIEHENDRIGVAFLAVFPERGTWESLAPFGFSMIHGTNWLGTRSLREVQHLNSEPHQWTIYSLQPDPQDSSAFFFKYRFDGEEGVVAGRIVNPATQSIQLKAISGPLAAPLAPPSEPSINR